MALPLPKPKGLLADKDYDGDVSPREPVDARRPAKGHPLRQDDSIVRQLPQSRRHPPIAAQQDIWPWAGPYARSQSR